MARSSIPSRGAVSDESGGKPCPHRLGQAIAVAAALIVASSGVSCDSAPVTDSSNSVASVVLLPESVSMSIAESVQFAATLHNAAGDVVTGSAVSWASANRAVATVSNTGLVTAVAAGSATITATGGGKSASANVTVSGLDHVSVTPATASIASVSTQPFAATGYDGAGNIVATGDATWVSSNTSVATINSSGVASGIAAGLATISATVGGKTGSATLSVTTSASCKLVAGMNAVVASLLAKPGYLKSVIDPDFGTTITRISGDPGTPIGGGVSGSWPALVYHNYPKDPVFTADQKLLVLKHMSGGPTLFLDGTTYQPLFARSGPANGGGEWRLHPTLPDIAVALGLNGSVSQWNVRTNVTTTKIPAVAGYTSNELGPSEGNLSRDGRYLVAKAVRSSDGHLVARVFDVDGGTTGAVIDLTAANVTNLDWVSISAGGGYVVAFATIDGATSGLRTKLWSRSTGAQVGYWSDNPLGHYDLGFDQAGNEVAFGSVSSGTYAHKYIMRRLDTGAITDLTGAVTSYNWHATTRNIARAGWGYAATNDRTGYPLDGEIYAVKLDGSFAIERYAHHRASNASYDRSAFPTPSPDGRRIVFASNWGDPSAGPEQAYVVDTRQLCPNGLPQ